MTDADELDVEQLARRASIRFDRRMVELAPATELAYDPASWEDAIVFVRAGTIDVDCASAGCGRFRRGDMLCFAKLSVRYLRNPGTEPAQLLVVSRRTRRRPTG